MISFGQNITIADDPLRKISVDSLVKAIKSPKPDSVTLIRQLRIVCNIDKQQYSRLKRKLPYVVCGLFNPSFRRSDNFSSTSYFVVDLDHLCDKQIDAETLRQRLSKDERVLLFFASPSGDGLKIMFRLKEPCYDAGLYSIFYKSFLQKFATQYSVEQVVDSRTSDVTRACFLSHDPDAYYNPNATLVDVNGYIDINNTLSLFQGSKKEPVPKDKDIIESPSEPSSSTIDNIKQILNLAKSRKAQDACVYVPEQINEIMDSLVEYVTATGLSIVEIQNIQYGKKVKSRIDKKQAETNIFYGKKGFSVVVSPRTGTDQDTNRLVAELIQSFFDTQI